MEPEADDGTKRVLVADDDHDVCALLHVVLTPLAAVTVVNDAEAALEAIASQPPFDAIVSDFMLPGISGLEFVQRVRSDERIDHVPILMISGHGRLVSDSARAAGCDAFLDKPFTLAQLRSTMLSLLGPRVRFA
ncbi:MAG: response regulator [Candidatus Eremiobacteraeota bacterium]|nr:response regulator [Candidatus Eremiobacteraeota bacterium]